MYYLQEYDRKQLLIKLAGKYEDMRYFNEDPVIFPRQYTKIQDIEISGFISAYLAFGNRKQIVKKCKVIDDMFEGKPYEWLMNRKYEKFKDNNDVFYRFVKYEDLHRIFGILFKTYDCYGKLEFLAEHWLHQGKELPYKLQEICSKSLRLCRYAFCHRFHTRKLGRIATVRGRQLLGRSRRPPGPDRQ